MNHSRSPLREELMIDLQSRLSSRIGFLVDPGQSWMEIGLDSVIACAFLSEINRCYACGLTLDILHRHPTLSALATFMDRLGLERIRAPSSREPVRIAVIGMSGRFPGADTPEALWKHLAEGKCSVTSIPSERHRYWDQARLAAREGSTFAYGAFLSDVERFDPLFFGISPKEAGVMDPQQRIFLEEAWKAFEEAGYSPEALSGQKCGVYAGVMVNDYHDLLTQWGEASVHELMDTASFLPARIAYHLNLTGPALAIDTASSSSLVALDMACRALAAGEIDLALAGGATLYLTQKRYTLMEKAGMLTPGGQCRVFDTAADGMMPGEAVGVVLLKRLSDALRDRDAIHGVILASGTGQSGKTVGITAPSVEAQADLMEKVYREGGVDPATISLIEAHGTGTRLGDPAEAKALHRAYGSTAAPGSIALGSIKANIGHSFAAAGVSGLIKVLLAMKHRALPPQIHVSEPQPLLRIGSGPFRLPQALEAWEASEGAPRRAAICGVGFSGTNAHLIVEEAPAREQRAKTGSGYWFTLSAPNEAALKRRAAALLAWLKAQDDVALADLSVTLTTGRAALEERLAFHASTREEVAAALEAFLKGEPDRYLRGRALASGKPGRPEEWVQGATVDWEGMAAELEAYRIHLPPDPLDGITYWYDRKVVMEKQSPEKLPPERPRPLTTPATPSQTRQAGTTAGRSPIRLKALVTTAPTPGRSAKEHTGTAPGGTLEEIRTLVRSLVAKTLYLEADQIRDDRRFQDLGFDSILAVDLAKAVSAAFGTSFSAASLYDHPSVQDLADHLASQGAPVSPEVSVPEPAHAELPATTSGSTGPRSEEVAKLAAGVLYLAPEKVRPEARFADLGLDSILAVELARAIAARWQVAFTAAELYSYPTPIAVAEMLQGKGTPTAPTAPSVAAASVVRVAPAVPEPAPAPVGQAAAPPLIPAKPDCDEPIAVIGFSGRFPGAPDSDAFWQQIAGGHSAIGASPAGRWKEPLQGGWLEGIDRFDAAFFRIAPPEAEAMDPQHRLFLQQAWATLEQAGYTPEELSRRTCGIFVGMGASDYSGDSASPSPHTLLGNTGSGLTARLAFLFDWKGPTMVVDTACASSLSALYLATRSLQNRECDVALAGGVHLATTSHVVEEARAMGLLSPSGTCRTFDAEADGFVIGEGVGAVLIKRLADAERDGDTIHGVIRAIGVSQDGARHGLSAPQASGQAALQKRVYERAGISPSALQYIELHGMSSPLSDEIELLALKQSFQESAALPEGSVAIGSVKPNIGHPLAASGMAGLIKLLLALRHRQIPPVGGLQTPNPALALEGTPFRIATHPAPWDASPRRAALNGLSATGTNCHLVIEDYPVTPASFDRGPALLVLSARSREALKARAADLLAALESHSFGLSDLAYTLQTGRRPMAYRLAFVARSVDEARAGLSRFLERGSADFSGTLHLGEAQEAEGMASLLISGEEGRLFLSVAVEQGAFDKLARLWVAGANIDFQLLHQADRLRRVPLPTYPFEEESYWKPTGHSATPASAVAGCSDTLVISPRESLCRWMEEALRLPAGGLSEESSLSELGFGSLYALSISARYEARYGAKLPLRFFYEARTVGELCRRVAAHHQPVVLSGTQPLSEGQKALWSLMSSEPTAYLIPTALRLETGTLERVTTVLQSLADEHPALRATFQWENGEPVRRLLSEFKVVVAVLSAAQRDRLEALAHRPLDPAAGPLWRAEWLPESGVGNGGTVLLTFHHLIFDGYSLGVLLEAFLDRLAALERGEAPVPGREISDHVFFEQERRYLASTRYQEDRNWWLTYHSQRWLGGLWPAKRSGDDGGALRVGEIAPELVQRLAALAARERVTLQAVMLAACEALLGARTPELVLGLPVDLRPESEREPLGYFVNLVALRSRWKGDCSFAAWCAERFAALLGGLEHRAFPYRHLAQALAERDGGAPPALEAAFYFLTWPNAARRQAFDQLERGIHQTGEFPLVIEVIEGGSAWHLHLKYRPTHLSDEEAEQIATDYLALLEAVAEDASRKLSELPLTPSQSAQEPMRFPSDQSVAGLFEEQARRSPEALAAAFDNESRSYAALDAEANQWAHYLMDQGVRPGMLVGVMWPRSLEMLIALLAVWKAGAAYVPLDPDYPADRIAMIVEDARLPFLLLPAGADGPERPGLTLLQPTRAAVEPQPTSPPIADAEAGDRLAYVIFTSGSTGRPKGVQIAHRSLAHFLWCMAERPGCGPGDRVLALTTISFDIAALELFLPLVTGGMVDVLPESVTRNGLRLREAIVNRRPTLVQATPATWKMLLLAKLPELPGVKALCGGEAWDEALAAELLPKVSELWNMYGPTETTIWSSIARVLPGEPVRLGEPIGNTQFYVLDEALRPVPRGEIGELYIGGDGLAKGYLHRPDLTSERFIPHPDRPGELIYRTGDLVRYV